MRIFDYRCTACGHPFEAFVRSAEEPRACPACGAPDAMRQPAAAIAVGTRRRGRTIDLSSGSCPCGRAGRGQAHR